MPQLPFTLHERYKLSEIMRYSDYFYSAYAVERDSVWYSVVDTYSFQYVFQNMDDGTYVCVERQRLDGKGSTSIPLQLP